MNCLGIASFAQERVFLDEKVRFFSEVAIYNELSVLRVDHGVLSMDRLSGALNFLLEKHKILRTSLVFNNDSAMLEQWVNDKSDLLPLGNIELFKDEVELKSIIYSMTTNSNLFDLSTGRVFDFRILRPENTITRNDEIGFISESDILVFAFHHAAVDRSSADIYLEDLFFAYNNKGTSLLRTLNHDLLEYIDYSIHERLIDMTLSRKFWLSQIEGYHAQCPLLLPILDYRAPNNQRSGLANAAEVHFSSEISQALIDYAASHRVTLFQLGLATFYAFLFKLTHGHADLCIAGVNANRYKVALENIIGMFVTTLPYRLVQ